MANMFECRKQSGGGGGADLYIDNQLQTDKVNQISLVTSSLPLSIKCCTAIPKVASSKIPNSQYHASALYKGKIHIMGESMYFMYDVATDTYERILPVPFNMCNTSSTIGLVVYNDELHAVGGVNMTIHWKYDGTSWTQLSSNIGFNFNGGWLIVYNNEIHAIGGNLNPRNTQHYKYDGTSWTNVATLPFTLNWEQQPVILNNKIWIPSMSPYEYDGTSWSASSIACPANAGYTRIFMIGDDIYLYCGSHSHTTSTDGNYGIYKYSNSSWTLIQLVYYEDYIVSDFVPTPDGNVHLISNYNKMRYHGILTIDPMLDSSYVDLKSVELVTS